MPLRGATPVPFRPFGVCDAIDGSNAPPGALSQAMNLIPNPDTAGQFVPRPAQVQITNFTGFTVPTLPTALLAIGTLVFGMISSSRFAGKDEPFCYDLDAGAFVTIGNVVSANCPTSPPATGAWEPPIMAQIGKRIMITHPGYSGANRIGWIDTRSFAGAATGDTHTSTLVDALSVNPLNVGWAVGDQISGAGIPAGTYIVSMTATSVVLSQAATATAAGVALTVASGTPGAPIYGAGNTNTTNLVARPVSVGQFNGRAYYAVANGLQWSDSLKPWQITNSTQALTLGDDVLVTALGGVPLSTQVTGGVVQALIAFKGVAPYWQITGDAAASNLAVNQVQGSIGTLAPLSLTPTPNGLAYMSPDGIRVIDPISGRADQVLGANGEGVAVPFMKAVVPSRVCAAFARNLLRVSVQNGAIDSQAQQEFWLHFARNIWSGPHSLPASLIQPCVTGDADFILAASGVSAKLFESNTVPSAASTYTENGAALMWNLTTSLLPENSTGETNHLVESTIGLQLPATQTMTIQAADEGNNVLDTITISGDGVGGAIWGAFTWGVGVWGGSVARFRQWTMPWTVALDFKQASIAIYGPSVSGFVLGNIIAKVQATGFQGGHP